MVSWYFCIFGYPSFANILIGVGFGLNVLNRVSKGFEGPGRNSSPKDISSTPGGGGVGEGGGVKVISIP